MLVIAHRGALNEEQENSWAAFEAAIAAKSDRLEMDIRLTKDNFPVVMHDDNLGRMTGHWVKVSELTIAELRTIKLNNGEAIPTLEEVVERLLPRIEINIETKDGGSRCSRETGAVVNNSSHKNKVIYSSFQNEHLEYFRDHHPDIRRACLWGSFEFDARTLSNLAPQIFLERIETNIFHPMAALVSQCMMEQAKLRNWIVYPWDSVHGEEDKDAVGLWTALKTYGIDGLCSNYPRQLCAWLEEIKLDEHRYL
jgi:glycerophosphoryl diester phosphodiesterase